MSIDRAALAEALATAYPWLAEGEVGPRAVDAGSCDRCRTWPRLLPTCGPVAFEALCAGCADEVGDDAWCAGHAAEGLRARTWAASLPDEWPSVVTLWWVASGEVRHVPSDDRLAPAVRALLPGRHG